MTKRFIIIALVLVLVCGALFVSCKPDPIKDNKAIGDWFGEFWIPEEEEGENGGAYLNICLTVKEDKTFEGEFEYTSEKPAKFTGTWTATSVNKGTLKFDVPENSVLPDKVLNFYADDTNLIAYEAEKGGEAIVLTRDK